MKLRGLLIILYLGIIISFFFNSYHYEINNQTIVITGFEALFTNQFYIIGNIFLGYILLSASYQIFYQLVKIFQKKEHPKMDTSITIVTNIQLVLSMVVVTFLGTFMEMLPLLMIGIIVLSALIKYKFDL